MSSTLYQVIPVAARKSISLNGTKMNLYYKWESKISKSGRKFRVTTTTTNPDIGNTWFRSS